MLMISKQRRDSMYLAANSDTLCGSHCFPSLRGRQHSRPYRGVTVAGSASSFSWFGLMKMCLTVSRCRIIQGHYFRQTFLVVSSLFAWYPANIIQGINCQSIISWSGRIKPKSVLPTYGLDDSLCSSWCFRGLGNALVASPRSISRYTQFEQVWMV